MLDMLTVAGHAILGPVEDGRIDRVRGVLVPGPVRLVAIVATLIAESSFVRPDVVPVPSEEIALDRYVTVNLGYALGSMGLLTVAWMLRVWFMWTARKSSYRFLAPGTSVGSEMGGFCIKQSTASMYFLRSGLDNEPLKEKKSKHQLKLPAASKFVKQR